MHPNLNKCIIRVPLLGINKLEDLRISDLSISSICDRLRLLCSPEIFEALYISSPDFVKAVESILIQSVEKLDNAKVLDIWLTFVKYYSRMCSRSTPYGLMASVGVINFGEKTTIQNIFNETIHAQLDSEIVTALSFNLEQSDVWKPFLLYFPNPSIYRQGNHLKYLEVVRDSNTKIFALSKVNNNPVLDKVLSYVCCGRNVIEISEFINSEFEETYAKREIDELIFELISNQIIVSELSSSTTKRTSFSRIIEGLNISEPVKLRTNLSAIDKGLRKISKFNWVENSRTLRGIEDNLKELNITRNGTPFNFNLIRSFSSSSFNKGIVEKVKVANELIGKVNESYKSETIDAFKAAFLERYENRSVLLTEVLDEEMGIGYPVGNIRNKNIDGCFEELLLPTSQMSQFTDITFNPFFLFLSNKVTECRINKRRILELTSEELKEFASNTTPLPASYSIFCTVLANCVEDIDRGNFNVLISNGSFTSASSPINRFSVSDPEIERLCQEIFIKEEEIFEGKIVAEVLHSPNTRGENITFRAVTRRYELPIESLSTHDNEKQVKLEDIWVTVDGNKLKLIWGKNQREIVPRISNSHPFNNPDSIPYYRFLGDLQLQDQQNHFLWRWGPLSNLDYLPRVVLDKHIICSLETWRIKISKDFFNDAVDPIKKLRERLLSIGLPRTVLLRQNGDNLLVIDIEDLSCLQILMKEFKKHSVLIVHEQLVTQNNLFIKDFSGNSYSNEIIIPYIAKSSNPEKSSSTVTRPKRLLFRDKRSFFPGDKFLYLKIYCTKNIGQIILLKYLAQIILKPQTESDCVFFIRYEDPDYHIRLRLKDENNSMLIPQIHKLLSKLINSKYIYKIQYDTYNRELNRYFLIPYEKTEMIFAADSRAILKILKYLNKSNRESMTWLFALKNIYSYLLWFGMSLDEMLSFCCAIRNDFFKELNLNDNKDFLKSLNLKLKNNYVSISEILKESNIELNEVYKILYERECSFSRILKASEIKKIRNHYALFSSYIHMSINRLFASDQRFKEAMTYDLLYNYLVSQKKAQQAKFMKTGSK